MKPETTKQEQSVTRALRIIEKNGAICQSGRAIKVLAVLYNQGWVEPVKKFQAGWGVRERVELTRYELTPAGHYELARRTNA